MRIFGLDIGTANTGIAIYDTGYTYGKKMGCGKLERATTINLSLSSMRKSSRFNTVAHRLNYYQMILKDIFGDCHKMKKPSDESLAVIEDYAYGFVKTVWDKAHAKEDRNYSSFWMCPHCNKEVSVSIKEQINRMPLQLAEAFGVTFAALSFYSIPFITVSPTQLKLFVAGKGNASKFEMMKALRKKYDFKLEDDHQYDALGLVHIGRYFAAFCKKPDSMSRNSYEYGVMVELMHHPRHKGIRDEIIKSLGHHDLSNPE